MLSLNQCVFFSFSVAWSVHVLISSSRTWRSGRTTCCPQDSSGENQIYRFFKIKLWQWCCVEPTGNTFCLCHTTRFLKLSDHCAFHTTYTCCTVWLIRDKGSHTWPLAWDVTNCALSFSENTKENNIGEMMDYGTQAARIISGLKMWNGLLALHDGLGHIGKRDKGGGELLLLAVAHF